MDDAICKDITQKFYIDFEDKFRKKISKDKKSKY